MACIIKYLSLPTKIVTFVSYMKKKVLTYAAAMMAAIMSSCKDDIEIHVPDEVPPAERASMVFDAKFLNDGTIKDVSMISSPVITMKGRNLTTYRHDAFGDYIAHFNNKPGETTSDSYYKFVYSPISEVRDALKGGYTIETQFMLEVEPDGSKEYCAFSALADGGTGIMVSSNKNGGCISFITNVSENKRSNWIRCSSGIRPERGIYYHVVGIWDKENGESKIYVNGKLMNTVKAAGEIILPKSVNYWWFAIGGDANDGNAENAWKGDIVSARIYGNAVREEQLEDLFKNANLSVPKSEFFIDNVSFLEARRFNEGTKFVVTGKGFKEGDKIKFQSLRDDSIDLNTESQVSGNAITAVIPGGTPAGSYRLVVQRGSAAYPLGITELVEAQKGAELTPKIIAHRGLHKNGVPENSLASLKNACELGCYGSETDVYITTDGELVINHDSTIGGKTIETSSYEELKDIRLPNGESIPTLDIFLDCIKKYNSTKLIIEFKNTSAARLDTAVQAVAEMVTEKGADNLVEFIGFSYNACKKIAEMKPSAMVGYLGGNLNPEKVLQDNIRSIDYQYLVLLNHKSWIEEAQRLGMVVNMWTPNSASDLMKCIVAGADCITTDNSDDLTNIIKTYFPD